MLEMLLDGKAPISAGSIKKATAGGVSSALALRLQVGCCRDIQTITRCLFLWILVQLYDLKTLRGLFSFL